MNKYLSMLQQKKQMKLCLTLILIFTTYQQLCLDFTVYGPWGRPDMALFKFTKSILEDRSIQIFNNGKMKETLLTLMI